MVFDTCVHKADVAFLHPFRYLFPFLSVCVCVCVLLRLRFQNYLVHCLSFHRPVNLFYVLLLFVLRLALTGCVMNAQPITAAPCAVY
jgi:hypothetical protein